MPVPSFAIVRGAPADFAEVDALREAIEWNAGSWFFAPVLNSGGVLPLVRDSDGTLIGMGLGAVFGNGGFIGNMVVHPEHQRRGIGAAVFEYLLRFFEANGVRTVQLEATPEGQSLYERYGFRPRWTSCTGVSTTLPSAEDDGVRPLVPGDWPAVRRLAAQAYGEDRGAFLEALAAEPGTLEFAVLPAADGEVGAFGVRREGRIGPLCARDGGAADTLARSLLSRSAEGTRIPVGSPLHGEFWTRLGVEVEDYDVRMTYGAEPADEPSALYAMLNGGIG